MTNTPWSWQFLILLTSYFSPVVVAFVQNPRWPNWKKYLVSIVFHTFVAFVYLGSTGYITKDLIKSTEQLVSVAGLLFLYSILSYTGVWKPRGINARVASLRAAGLRKLGLSPVPNPASPSNILRGNNDSDIPKNSNE